MKIRVKNMRSSKGNNIPNLFVIYTNKGEYFQSYSTIIGYYRYKDQQTFLDKDSWDYSVTTGKYRNMWTGDYGIKETREHIANGKYKLKNLN